MNNKEEFLKKLSQVIDQIEDKDAKLDAMYTQWRWIIEIMK